MFKAQGVGNGAISIFYARFSSTQQRLILTLATLAAVSLIANTPVGAQNIQQLFVSSFGNNSVVEYNGTDGTFLDVFVQGNVNDLDGPWALTFGADGNLYVSSFGTDQVRRYDGTTGAFIDVFVTAGSGGLDQPFTLAFGPDGHLYVSSAGTRQILRYDGTTGAFIDVFVAAGSGGLGEPSGFVFGPDGNLYVGSFDTDEVLRYNGSTGAFIDVFVAAGSGGLDSPAGVVFGTDSHLYVNSRGLDAVLRYDGATGAFIDTFVTTASGGLDEPEASVFGPDGHLYVSSRGSDQVLRYNGDTGAFVDAFVGAGSGGLSDPFGFVFGADGNLYVTSFATDQILRYNGVTGAFINAFVSVNNVGLDQPEGLIFGADKNLYVASRGTNQILRYDGITGVLIDVFVAAGSGGLDSPRFLVFGPDGNLYVSSSGSDEVLRYDGATGAFIDAFVAAGSGGLDDPFGLSFGTDGHLYVSSRGTDQVLRYNGATGAFIDAFVTAGSGGLDLPWGLVFGADANLYVTSRGTNQVLRYNGTTGAFIDAFVAAGSGGLAAAFCLDFGPDGNLYVCSFGTDQVLRYNGTTGEFLDAFVSLGSGGLDGPTGLVFRKFISLSKTVLLGTNGITLQKEAHVAYGNIIDNASDGKITIGKGVTTPGDFDLIADSVVVKKNAEVASHVTYNHLKDKGNITGEMTQGAQLPVFDELPPFQSAAAGTEKITVGRGESRNLPPGDYGKIVVKKNGRVIFSGGTYNVESIQAKSNASLLFNGAAQVRVAKNMKAGKDTFVGPADSSAISAADIVFYVAGKKVKLGKNGNVLANFYAPNGTIQMKNGGEAVGGFIAEKLKIGKQNTLKLDSFVSDGCSLNYNLPADIGVSLPATTDVQWNFDQYSWNTFLALNAPGVGQMVNQGGDNPTQWQNWSSTVDLIQCNRLAPFDPIICNCPDDDCTQSGSHFYPKTCRDMPNYQDYRVLGQLSKVDDSFLQAGVGTLSNDALLDSKGNFLRYEILVSPYTYQFAVENEFYKKSVIDGLTEDVVFPCGELSYTGGDPANPQMGAIVVKNAWMELAGRDPKQYHTEEVLVYSPADRTSNRTATCELKTMALVGMHFEHKTTKQPNWTWSTFEHRLNAPDCTALPAAGNEKGSSGPSEACPAAVAMDYNFYPKKCSVGEDPDACQSCNVPPESNAPPGECLNTTLNDPNDTGWCLDLGPAATKGMSKVCRQVPVKANYSTAHDFNSACALSLFHSVWGNYQLMSTQWYDAASSVCQNGKNFSDRTLIAPQVGVSASADGGVTTRPFLGNTSMETYARSDCTGCHSQAEVKATKVSTDGMWWLVLEAGDSSSP